jgi:hypothetical protein
MGTLLSFLGLNREQQMITALVSVIVASVFVSVGAWTLLLRERRAGRTTRPETKPESEQATLGPDGP